MSTSGRDRLIVTEDSDDDHEREEVSSNDGSENESTYNNPADNYEEIISFPNPQRKKKVVKKLTKKEQSLKRSMKEFRFKLALVKPDVTTNREFERGLRRIATKGVVQLFNAVSDRQKTMSDAVKEKMTARERKEARDRFDGKNFDVSKFGDYSTKKEVKGEDNEEENMEIGEEEIDRNNYSDED